MIIVRSKGKPEGASWSGRQRRDGEAGAACFVRLGQIFNVKIMLGQIFNVTIMDSEAQ